MIGQLNVDDKYKKTPNMDAIREFLANGASTQKIIIDNLNINYSLFKRAINGMLSNGEVVSRNGFYELTPKGRQIHAEKTLDTDNLLPKDREYFQLHEINQLVRRVKPETPVPKILRTIRENNILATPLGKHKMFKAEQVKQVLSLIQVS